MKLLLLVTFSAVLSAGLAAGSENATLVTEPESSQLTGVEGEPFNVSCEGFGGRCSKFSAMKWTTPDGKEISAGQRNPKTVLIDSKLFLIFTNPKLKDSGSYRCSAVYDGEEELERKVFIEFYAKERIRGKKPKFQSLAYNASVEQGLIVKLYCSAESKTPLTYDWFNQAGDKISRDSRKRIFVSNSSSSSVLTINGVQQKDEGQYHCMAKNMNGLENKFYHLEVLRGEDAGGVRMITRPGGHYVRGLEGKPVNVSCEAAGGERSKFSEPKWKTIDGEEITEGDPSASNSEGKVVLTFMNPRINDSTSFLCTAVYDGEVELQYEVFFEIHGHKPEFPFYSEDIIAAVGGWVRVPCRAQGELPITYNWYDQNAEKITEATNVTIYATQSGDQSFLTFSEVSTEDQGTYTCSASNSYGQVNKLYTLRVFNSTGHKPEFPFYSEDIIAAVGGWVRVPCRAQGELPITYNWYDQNAEKITEDTNVTIYATNRGDQSFLTFSEVSTEDQGTYTCSASNSYGQVNKLYKLRVFNSAGQKPEFPSYSEDIIAEVGGWVRVPCRAQGELPITYNWYDQNAEKITEATNVTIYAMHSGDQSFLTFSDVSTEDQGTYTCSASNSYGQVNKLYRIRVFNSTGMKPKFSLSFEDRTVDEGKRLELRCLAMGERPITYNWYNQEEDKIPEDERSSVYAANGEKYSLLNFQKLSVAHRGTYTCTASNAHGLVSKVFLVNVASPGGS